MSLIERQNWHPARRRYGAPRVVAVAGYSKPGIAFATSKGTQKVEARVAFQMEDKETDARFILYLSEEDCARIACAAVCAFRGRS